MQIKANWFPSTLRALANVSPRELSQKSAARKSQHRETLGVGSSRDPPVSLGSLGTRKRE